MSTQHDVALVENAVKTMLSLAETFTHEGVEIWLRNPNKLMDDQKPIDLLYAGDEKPLQIAEGLADGVFW